MSPTCSYPDTVLLNSALQTSLGNRKQEGKNGKSTQFMKLPGFYYPLPMKEQIAILGQ